MKILIFYANYGGGHLSAAKAIKEAFNNQYPEIDVEMIDCMDYVNKMINKITTSAYTGMAKKTPKMWGTVYKASKKGPISQFTKTSNKLLSLKLHKLIKKINPNVIVCTHPFATQMCTSLKKQKKIDVKIANVLTDFKSHNQWLVKHEYIDYFFIANEKMKVELEERGISSEKIYVTGIPISANFSKKYERQDILKENMLKDNKKTILFFAGGKYGLAKRSVYDILEILAREFKDVQVIAISGKNEKIYNKFIEIVRDYNAEENIKVIEYTEKVPELMSISDIVITKPRRNNKLREYGKWSTNNFN